MNPFLNWLVIAAFGGIEFLHVLKTQLNSVQNRFLKPKCMRGAHVIPAKDSSHGIRFPVKLTRILGYGNPQSYENS